MHLLDQRITGMIVLLLWAMLMVAKGMATGSLLKDRPRGGVRMWLTHVFNFLFLLVAIPLAAISLMIRRPQALDPTPLALGTSGMRAGTCVAGMLLYGAGCILLLWALFTLRENYQVGGNSPRASDELVTGGPYRFVRHPMYAAALCISLGVACLTHSLTYFCMFCIYVLVIFLLIPLEEDALRRHMANDMRSIGIPSNAWRLRSFEEETIGDRSARGDLIPVGFPCRPLYGWRTIPAQAD